MSLSVTLNGQPRIFDSLEPTATLLQLIAQLGLKSDRIAVEHNGEIAPRSTWQQTSVHPGDKLEVVHFVGGGAQ